MVVGVWCLKLEEDVVAIVVAKKPAACAEEGRVTERVRAT
jgi:hypothetical protein